MSDLEHNDPSQSLLDPLPRVRWRKITDVKDADGQNLWLTVVLVFFFGLAMSCITQNLGYILFIFTAVITVACYSSLRTATSRKRILLCCIGVGLGISLIRLSQAPVDMEYCKIQRIRLPPEFNNSSTGSELTLHVCITHRYSLATPPNTNTSDSVSTLYLVPPNIVSKLYKFPLSQLSSFLQNPEFVTSWKSFIEKRVVQWMERLYNQDFTKETNQGESDNKLDTKSTPQDPVQSEKMNAAGDASNMDVG